MHVNQRIITLSKELSEAEQRRSLDLARIASCSRIGSVLLRDNYPYKVLVTEKPLEKSDIIRLTGFLPDDTKRYVLIEVKVSE